MDEPISQIARRVAVRLADPHRDLAAHTEQLLTQEAGLLPQERSLDAGTSIALAGFILSAAQFAWTVYRDLKRERGGNESGAAALQMVLSQQLRLQLGDTPEVSLQQRDRALAVVVEEVIRIDAD